VAGVRAALEASPLPFVLTVPGDAPFLPADLVARLQIGMTEELDDFVRPVAEDHVGHGQPDPLRDRLAQIVSPAIRIKMRPLDRLDHGLTRLGRRTERILVRSQLDDLAGRDPQLAGQVLDRLAGLVSDQFTQLRIRVFPHGANLTGEFGVCERFAPLRESRPCASPSSPTPTTASRRPCAPS
jgi:hypothetical protein